MPRKQLEIPEPNFEIAPPKTVLGFPDRQHTFEHEDGTKFFLGRGKRTNPDVMFVSSCPLEEELDTFGAPSMLLAGTPGALFDHATKQAGLPLHDHYYTTLCKYALPRSKKLKPSTADIERCALLFERELKQRKPKVVVCLGKFVFDYFYHLRFVEKDILGGWFKPNAHTLIYEEDGEYKQMECYRDFDLFVTRPIHMPAVKPEVLEAMFYDLVEVASHLDYMEKGHSDDLPTNYQRLRTEQQIVEWAEQMDTQDQRIFAVDCEWAGDDYLTGTLRSVQFCWAPGEAVYIEFFDENGTVFMEPDERERALSKLQSVMNKDYVRFIGHNFSADYLWMKHHLDIDPFRRCLFDTMYAMHTADETYDLKLERLSIRFTTLGRYDIELIQWKKENKAKMTDGGYGAIPSDILFPYACADVDVPMRAYPKLVRLLMADNTLNFFLQNKLRFVTDGFAHMTESGVPLNAEDAKNVRMQFTMASQMMLEVFKQRVRETADNFLLSELEKVVGAAKQLMFNQIADGTYQLNDLKNLFDPEHFAKIYKKLRHWQDARDFNPNSSDQKIRWLYDFKELRPIKSTKTDDGPSVAWEKIEALPPAKQREYKPSTDKDVLQIYAENDDDIQLLVEQLAIYQVIKSFLKSEDKGLESFIREDGRVHTSFLCTETNRPRSISPNILNIPAYLSTRLESGFKRATKLLQDRYGEDDIQKAYRDYLEELSEQEPELAQEMPTTFAKPVPLRWCFRAPPGWCYVDADYATAEVFSIAYLSGDMGLVDRLTSDDPQFVKTEKGPVRVAYIEGVSNYEYSEWDESLVTPIDKVEGLILDASGQPAHPKRDVHWEMAEHPFFMNRPREKMVKSKERAAGKIGNFQIPYQSSAGLLNRLVELATGVKPPEDTGENLIEAYKSSNPVAWEFLERVMEKVSNPGYYVCPSGARRHFKTLTGISGVSEWKQNSSRNAQRRQASNYPMQGLVAQTLARAVIGLMDAFRERNLKARIVCPLYDALYCVCPVAEVEEVRRLMTIHMSENNTWNLPGGNLKFNLDFDVTKRWSIAPTEEEQKELDAV
jgi:uracil-DNA glycosylase family 4